MTCKKKRYKDRLDALFALSQCRKQSSPSCRQESRIYHCPHCGGFHLTSQKRPMFERRSWGTYNVIDLCEFPDGHSSLTKKLIIKPNHHISYQSHKHRTEIWSIVDGIGMVVIDDDKIHVHKGDVVIIESGQKHAIKAITKMTIIEVQHGTNLVEDDIERYDYDWRKINCETTKIKPVSKIKSDGHKHMKKDTVKPDDVLNLIFKSKPDVEFESNLKKWIQEHEMNGYRCITSKMEVYDWNSESAKINIQFKKK